MIVNLNESNFASFEANRIKKFFLYSLIIYAISLVLNAVIGAISLNIYLDGDIYFSDNVSIGSELFKLYEKSSTIDTTKIKKIENLSILQNIIYFLCYSSLFCVLVGFIRLGRFAHTSLVRYIVFCIISSIFYIVCLFIAVFVYFQYPNFLNNIFICGNIINITFIISIIYFYYKICKQMHLITNVSIFLTSFKFMFAYCVLMIAPIIYFVNILFFDEYYKLSSMGIFMIVSFIASCICSFISLIAFILGVYRIKSVNIKLQNLDSIKGSK